MQLPGSSEAEEVARAMTAGLAALCRQGGSARDAADAHVSDALYAEGLSPSSDAEWSVPVDEAMASSLNGSDALNGTGPCGPQQPALHAAGSHTSATHPAASRGAASAGSAAAVANPARPRRAPPAAPLATAGQPDVSVAPATEVVLRDRATVLRHLLRSAWLSRLLPAWAVWRRAAMFDDADRSLKALRGSLESTRIEVEKLRRRLHEVTHQHQRAPQHAPQHALLHRLAHSPPTTAMSDLLWASLPSSCVVMSPADAPFCAHMPLSLCRRVHVPCRCPLLFARAPLPVPAGPATPRLGTRAGQQATYWGCGGAVCHEEPQLAGDDPTEAATGGAA